MKAPLYSDKNTINGSADRTASLLRAYSASMDLTAVQPQPELLHL